MNDLDRERCLSIMWQALLRITDIDEEQTTDIANKALDEVEELTRGKSGCCG